MKSIHVLTLNLSILMQTLLAAYFVKAILPAECEWWRYGIAAAFLIIALELAITAALIREGPQEP